MAATYGLPDAETTLPELIAGAGYLAGIFGKWHLGPGSSEPFYGPLDQGFEEHRGIIEGMVPDYALWDKYENGVYTGPATTYATLENAEDAVDWIGNQTGRWLAMVAFNAPHTPLHTPTFACDGVSTPAADINGMIECMDYHIGSLLTELDNLDKLANTTVIFVGDNGTESASILPPFDLNADSHKGNVYEGGIRVPFIISDGYHLVNGTEAPVSSGVGRIRHPGLRESALVHTVDIFATVAAIVGVQSHAEDSFSLIPYMASSFRMPMVPLREYTYTDRCQSSLFQAAIRNDQYKLIYKYPGPLPYQPELELYDVADIEEINPVANLAEQNLLLYELDSMWNSEGYDPTTGICP